MAKKESRKPEPDLSPLRIHVDSWRLANLVANLRQNGAGSALGSLRDFNGGLALLDEEVQFALTLVFQCHNLLTDSLATNLAREEGSQGTQYFDAFLEYESKMLDIENSQAFRKRLVKRNQNWYFPIDETPKLLSTRKREAVRLQQLWEKFLEEEFGNGEKWKLDRKKWVPKDYGIALVATFSNYAYAWKPRQTIQNRQEGIKKARKSNPKAKGKDS